MKLETLISILVDANSRERESFLRPVGINGSLQLRTVMGI